MKRKKLLLISFRIRGRENVSPKFIYKENVMDKKFLEIGRVVNTHGICGELKIQPWCDDPEIYNELDNIIIGENKYKILRARYHKNCEIVQIEGINSINEAEQLKNLVVTVSREQMPNLPEGRYYIVDLMGLEVRTPEGKKLGFIDDIIKTGSNDVYVLKSDLKKPILLPVIDEVIKEVNISDGYVIAQPLKGLIDDED